jgi:prefoldin beta subunit
MADDEMKELQLIEQNIQQLLMQKQQYQAQLVEVESAQKELVSTSVAYKIIGNIMVLSEKDALGKELSEKKEMLDLRLKSIDKQESRLRDKAQSLQKQVLGKMKNE